MTLTWDPEAALATADAAIIFMSAYAVFILAVYVWVLRDE